MNKTKPKTAPKSSSGGKAKKSALKTEVATRARSIDFAFFGGFLPNPDPILKKMGKDQQVYEEILGDGHLSGIIATRASGVKRLKWEIDRGKSKSEAVAMLEKRFKSMNMRTVIDDILNGQYRGYAVLEINWEYPEEGGWILPKSFPGKPSEWFQYDEDNQLRFRTLTDLNGELLPPNKFIVARRKASYNNPYGEALLSKCYWPAVFKRSGLKFWMTFTEKYGIPYIIGKLPRGAAEPDYEELKNRLEEMVADAVAAIPDDASIELLEVAGKTGSVEAFEKLVAWADAEMSKVIIGHAAGADSTPGKLGGEDNAQDVKEYLVEEDKAMVEDTMNELIRVIWEINVGAGEPPEFSLYEEASINLDQSTQDKSLTDQGVKLSKAYYKKTYGLEDEDIESIHEPEPVPTLLTGPGGRAGMRAALPKPGKKPAKGKGPAFAERRTGADQDQAALEEYIDNLQAAELRAQAEELLRPVIDMIEAGTSYEQILEDLPSIYKEMDPHALQETLRRAIFVSEMIGQASVDAE